MWWVLSRAHRVFLSDLGRVIRLRLVRVMLVEATFDFVTMLRPGVAWVLLFSAQTLSKPKFK